MSSKTKLRRTLALALAGGSLAIGVPAALGAGGSDSGAPATRSVQNDRSAQDRPGHDCPERDRAQGSGSGDADAATPEV
ncbi:MAG TPA: hypothetical protein VK631_20180 [Solirubrobacteraceae bacterium]|nr:hypothetical protein [Solirubrobacteraceae bacterium]